jgi:branched-chain amino acid transport system permease protein
VITPKAFRREFFVNLFEIVMSYVLFGISVGGQYALIAIGYTMVFGILRLINFAHGDVFMVSALFMVYIAAELPLYMTIPIVVVLTMFLSFVIERSAYKPLRQAPRMSVMVSAIGVSYLLRNLALYITGGLNRVYPPIPWVSDPITVFGVAIRRVTVITPFFVIALVIILVWLIHHTKVGIAMRAVAKDFETSELMGIKIDNVISSTFFIGSFLAAMGSILFFSNYPGVTPFAGAMPGMKAFVAAVFGGIGSIPGAVLGGFLIGIFESIIKGLDTILGPAGSGWIQSQWEFATFSDAFTFFLLVVILVFKPSGLFGEKTTDKV